MTPPIDKSPDRALDDQLSKSGPVDWNALRAPDEARQLLIEHGYLRPTDRVDDIGATALTADFMLEELAPLDDSMKGVPVADLHPDRFVAASPDESDSIKEMWNRRDGDPYEWVRHINPGYAADERLGRPGRTTNCAECARSVQATLEGRPTAAASIDARGLPLAGQPDGEGEALEYTEQWAGRHAAEQTFDEIERHLRSTEGSAIVILRPDVLEPEDQRLGHMTNAVFDRERDGVLWVDGQIGKVTEWPPPDRYVANLRATPLAIYFD